MKLNLVDNNQKIPAGLVDNSIEFFIHEGDIKCTYAGSKYSFDEFPAYVIDIVNQDMEENPVAIASLVKWGFEDVKDQMKQYLACRFGGFDASPDVCADGKIQPAEYVDCGRRGICPFEGKLCCSVKVENGYLSKTEVAVLRELGLEDLDKIIADKLNISIHTLRHHKDNISTKTGVSRKPALAVLAFKLGLL